MLIFEKVNIIAIVLTKLIRMRILAKANLQRLCENDFLNYYSMSKIRKYDSSPSMATMKVLEGSRVEFMAHYYPAKGFYAPRYHFENFNLSFAELNYEISRFIRFICKLTADPSFGSRLDYADSELDMKYGVEGF